VSQQTQVVGAAEATERQAPTRRRRKPLTERARAERKLAFILVAPAAVVMLAVTAYPIGYAIYLSLERYDLRFPGQKTFVGFANYGTILQSGNLWWKAFGITVFIAAVSVGIELAIGMGVALVMHRTLFGRGLVRTAVLVPYGIVTVVAAYSWQYAWTPGTGYLANLLPNSAAPLTSFWPAIGIIILAEIWKTTPFMALLLLAGLSLVSEDLLKAARVDGATAWQRFTKVILPVMKPAILVALLFRTLDAFRIFDNIFILTQGSHDTRSVSILNYDQLFTTFNLGVGSAMAVLIFITVALIAFVYIKGFGTAAPGQELR
jgi:multiple sugar transport system permease protein